MKKLLIIFVVISCSYILKATNYYVATAANGGSNSNTGLSGHPWLTLAYAGSQATTVGDTIHIGTGTFNETTACILSPGVSIIGNGDISNIVNTYATTGHHAAIELLSSTDATNGVQSISYIKLDGNNGAGYNGIYIKQRENVSIHHCTIINFNHNGVSLLGAATEYSKPTVYPVDNQIYNCIIQDCEDLILLMGQESALIYDNILDNRMDVSRITRIIDAGTSYNKGTKFYNNKCYKPDAGATGDIWNFMIEHWDGEGGIEVYGNEFYGSDCVLDIGGNYNIKGNYAYSWSIHDNLFTTLSGTQQALSFHGSVAITVEGQTLEYVYIYNNRFEKLVKPVGSSEGGEPAGTFSNYYIHHNLIIDCGLSTNGSSTNPVLCLNQYLSASQISNINIYNNVITSNGNTNIGGIWVQTHSASNINIKNNIIAGCQNFAAIWLTNDGAFDNIHIDYNCFYNNMASIDIAGPSLTNYTTVHNITDNPLFVSTSDYHLASNSPCIDAGVYVGVPYNDTAPDIGAFEYGTTIPDPDPEPNPASGKNVKNQGKTVTHYGQLLKY